MATDKILALARKHLGGVMESSARFCLAEAVARYDDGDLDAARRCALDSLKYSVGVFHADYRRAAA